MKDWKKAKKEAEAANRPPKLTPQQILRNAGFNDQFFVDASLWGIKVDKATVDGDSARVTFKGVEGNGANHTVSLPLLNGTEPVHPAENHGSLLRTAYDVISGHNPQIRKFKGPKIAEGPAARPG